MLSDSEPSNVEIHDVITGQLIYQSMLERGKPVIIDRENLPSGQFHIKVYNSESLVNEIVIVR